MKKLVAADCRPRRPVRCLGMTSDHRQPRCVLGVRTDDGTSGTGGIVSSVMSLTSRCVTMMVVLVCAASKGRNR